MKILYKTMEPFLMSFKKLIHLKIKEKNQLKLIISSTTEAQKANKKTTFSHCFIIMIHNHCQSIPLSWQQIVLRVVNKVLFFSIVTTSTTTPTKSSNWNLTSVLNVIWRFYFAIISIRETLGNFQHNFLWQMNQKTTFETEKSAIVMTIAL